MASIKLAEAPASANALPPATGTVSDPAPPIEPEQISATTPEPVEMPIEVQVKVDELHAEINALNKGSASVGIPGLLLAAGGFTGFIIHHYKLKSANNAFDAGTFDQDDYDTLENSPDHRTGFAIMMVGGFCMVIPALVMENVARAKGRELAGIQAQYATAGLYDVRLQVAAAIDPGKSLVMYGLNPETGEADRSATRTFVLEPLDGAHTRMITRQRLIHEGLGASLLWHIVEPLNYVMEREMLRGIRRPAESG